MENRKASGLCPTWTLKGVPAQLGQDVRETASWVISQAAGTLQPKECFKEEFVYQCSFPNISNTGILITIFTYLISKPYF
jgi:hypothetical protein